MFTPRAGRSAHARAPSLTCWRGNPEADRDLDSVTSGQFLSRVRIKAGVASRSTVQRIVCAFTSRLHYPFQERVVIDNIKLFE